MSSPDAPPSEKFLSGFTPEAIAGYIKSGRYSYLVAHIAEKLVGVLGIRDHQHLYHLFVAESVQRQGIARALWTYAKTEIMAKTSEVEITVNSSLNAIGVYERFGFTAVGPRVDINGISFVQMKCVVRHGRC
jgi:ribosomal protein S18 acetylase RimI-like enzyme